MTHRLPDRAARTHGLSRERLARISVAFDSEIASGRMPGGVLAIAHAGELVYHEAFGDLDPVAGARMPRDAIFSIASMTKPLVSVGALMLYEEGRLMVNEPVSAYLPELANMRTAQDATGTAHARAMTVQDLMRHTAGLTYGQRGARDLHPDYPPSSNWVAERWSSAEFLQRIAALPLHYAPGTCWDYSFGFDVLGLIIERVTGLNLGRYLAERLFDPLGMRDTAFVIPEEKISRYARALGTDPLTQQPQNIRDGTQRKKFECGGGGAVSTAADYLRFAQMLCNGGALDGTRVLGRKTVDYMTADHIGPEVDTTRLNQYPNINGYGFGLGVAVRRRAGVAGVMSSIGEFHWAGSTGTYFWVDPAESLVVVFMAHTPGHIRYYYRQMLHALVLQALV